MWTNPDTLPALWECAICVGGRQLILWVDGEVRGPAAGAQQGEARPQASAASLRAEGKSAALLSGPGLPCR